MSKTKPRGSAKKQGRWLVIAAWPPELAYFEAGLPTLPAQVRQRVVLASVGVGMVEAGIATAQLLARNQPDFVLLVGTAGVYPRQPLALDQAAIALRVRLLPQILPSKHAYLPAIVPTEVRTSPTLVRALRKAAHLPCADVACPMGITATKQAAVAASKLSGCALENLEAFAVARAAAVAKVPFAAVLGVANHVGPNGHREWERHAKSAAESACRAIVAFFADYGAQVTREPAESSPASAARSKSTSMARHASGAMARVSSLAYMPK
jgi:nucleoside phosphorylase